MRLTPLSRPGRATFRALARPTLTALTFAAAAACSSIKQTTFTAPPGAEDEHRTAVVAFYNVENLFDTQDDPKTADEEYTPNSELRWDDVRYRAKLTNMASVIEQLGSFTGPDVVGLAEVENRRVLEDLVATPALAPRKYKIAHFESPDPRGIDVALLYKADRFTLTEQKVTPVTLPDTALGTRDLLQVSGQLNGQPITFIVNHWPSRRGGSPKSAARREAAADQARKLVDAALAQNPQARVLLMGDFNDTPRDSSIASRRHLNATFDVKALRPNQLYNPFYDYQIRGRGSIYYRGKGDVFDQMMLTPGLCGNTGLRYQGGSANIYSPPRLQSQEEKYLGEPLRTYGGKKYLGGFSDHFPVYLTLTK